MEIRHDLCHVRLDCPGGILLRVPDGKQTALPGKGGSVTLTP